MKVIKPKPIEVAQKVDEAVRRGPNIPRMKTWDDLVNNLKKLKIDTVRAVVEKRRFKDFFQGYYPDLEFDYRREEKLLNKLITEKNGYAYLVEGYYFYEETKRLIPKKHLDTILWPKK